MSFDQEQSHVLSLHDAVVEIKATLNNGLKVADPAETEVCGSFSPRRSQSRGDIVAAVLAS